MGYLQAMEMAEHASLEQGLHWHLQANHYPPVPTTMIPACIEAIELAIDENWDAQVELPDGISYQGRTTAPVWAMVDQHHLGPWIVEAS